MSCRISIAQEWSLRLQLELESHKYACFITLTYDDQNLPEGSNLKKEDIQKFIKRLRWKISPQKIKTFYVGEYGDSLRPHYHGIIFGWRPDSLYYVRKQRKRILFGSKEIDELWKKGYNTVGTVTDESIGYVTQYCTKKLYGPKADEIYGDRVRPFLECSKGLGLDWIKENSDKVSEDLQITRKGKRRAVPRYMLKKIGVQRHEIKRLKDKYEEKLKEEFKRLDENELHKEVLKARCQREKNLKSKEEIYEALRYL